MNTQLACFPLFSPMETMVDPPILPFIHPSIRLSVYPSIHPSIQPSIYPSLPTSFLLSLHPSIHLSSSSTSFSIYPFYSFPIHLLSIQPFIHPSTQLFTHSCIPLPIFSISRDYSSLILSSLCHLRAHISIIYLDESACEFYSLIRSSRVSCLSLIHWSFLNPTN